jgi:hypothetical protein
MTDKIGVYCTVDKILKDKFMIYVAKAKIKDGGVKSLNNLFEIAITEYIKSHPIDDF